MEKQTNYNNTNSYLISILITQNGYSFFDYSRDHQKVDNLLNRELKNATAEEIWIHLQEDLSKHNFFEDKTALVQIIYHHPYFAVVPKEIYDPSFNSDYLKFNTQLYKYDTIVSDYNSECEVIIPFVPYENIHNELLNTFKQIEFTHTVNISLSICKNLIIGEIKEQAFVIKNSNSFILIIFKGNQLLYSNYFEYSTPEDFAYYVLFSFEQFNCNRDQIKLSLIGDISKESDLYKYLYTFIQEVNIVSNSDLNFEYKLTTTQNKENNIFINNPFLALHLCE